MEMEIQVDRTGRADRSRKVWVAVDAGCRELGDPDRAERCRSQAMDQLQAGSGSDNASGSRHLHAARSPLRRRGLECRKQDPIRVRSPAPYRANCSCLARVTGQTGSRYSRKHCLVILGRGQSVLNRSALVVGTDFISLRSQHSGFERKTGKPTAEARKHPGQFYAGSGNPRAAMR